MVFGYENGKVAKINLTSYQTKQQRGCLNNAYHKVQKLIFVRPVFKDVDILVHSVKDKVLIFNTSLILTKIFKESQVNQVLRNTDRVRYYKELAKLEFENHDYYLRETIPSSGYYLRDGDEIRDRKREEQMRLFGGSDNGHHASSYS
jgi:DNA gyrase subunit A